MVASEVESYNGTISSSNSNSSTHIYCNPVKIKDAGKVRNSIESGDLNGRNKTMSSNGKVPSSVVAIDVSGQPFSRMASFRRSLIHVDFLIRRKRKKDKRRNTVAEGDVKELKDALQKIVNDECQFNLPNSICSYQQIITESKNAYITKEHDNQVNDRISSEKNNNAANIKSMKKSNCVISVENENIVKPKGKNNLSNGEGVDEVKLNDVEIAPRHSVSKRKPKSHIPISTVSAAMNVAVEMRQYNGIKSEDTVLNGINHNMSDQNSSDSDNKHQDNRHSNSSSCNGDGSQEESWASYKRRLQEKYKTYTTDRKGFNDYNTSKEIEVSSSASSENIDPQDNTATVGTSTESDTFFISSDESDEDSTAAVYFQENFGSLTSLGTASDGSLNSLLSETGTEMTSSTGTLTSVGREHLLTPPPPPPPMILSATLKDKDIVEKVSNSECFGFDTRMVRGRNCKKPETVLPKPSKQIKPPKHSKTLKPDLFDLPRNRTESSKNIFTSLVSLKTHSKDKNKSKYKDGTNKKISKNTHQPAFDMYGNNSPTKVKQIPTFIKENISPVIQNEGKSHMKSFFVNDKPFQLSENEITDKLKFDPMPDKDAPNTSDLTKSKGVQTVSSIPPKYEHQVTVTPVQRCAEVENRTRYSNASADRENHQNSKYGDSSRQINGRTENQICTPKVHRPQPPSTLQQERSKAARVVLDFDGKVIYSTNSLDRKYYNTDPNVNMYNTAQNASCDPHFKDMKYNYDNGYCNSYQEDYSLHNPAPWYTSKMPYSQDNAIIYSSYNAPLSDNNIKRNRSGNGFQIENESYRMKPPFDHFQTADSQIPQIRKSENLKTLVPRKIESRPYSYAGNSSDTFFNSPLNMPLPDPNISGLPCQENMLTKHNVHLHLKQIENMSLNTPDNSCNSFSDVFCTSPSSQSNCGSIRNKSPQSTMSTEDLFAVIHNCKKRMNIKTDSDISLASSSRSSSPSYLRPSSSKSTLVETGFLSPRSQVNLETSGDRRSWADFRPVDSICNERKSLAIDRLGPTKPTSMHDFKMLLLQARTSSQISGPRKSAVEMLKVPLNQNNRSTLQSLALNLSPRNSISMSVQNSPTSELNFHNGHSTVPFKRGNRVRASLQPRYIMYPPIFEDCSEDTENCSELITNKSSNTNSREGTNGKEHSARNQSKARDVISNQDSPCDNEIKLQHH